MTVLFVAGATAAGAPELPGIKVRLLKSSSGNHQELLRRITSWLRKHPCDVVHLQDWPALASELRKALQPHPPQLIVNSSHMNSERTNDHAGLEQADWLITPPQKMASWAEQLSWLAFHERLPRRTAKVHIDTKAVEVTQTEASTSSILRPLLKQVVHRTGRGYQRLLSLIRRT